jgi:hypothetical protein
VYVWGGAARMVDVFDYNVLRYGMKEAKFLQLAGKIGCSLLNIRREIGS